MDYPSLSRCCVESQSEGFLRQMIKQPFRIKGLSDRSKNFRLSRLHFTHRSQVENVRANSLHKSLVLIVRQAMSSSHFLHYFRNFRVMHMADQWEQVVLHLKIQPDLASKEASYEV